MRKILLLLLAVAPFAAAQAKVTLPSLFGDNMVLQQQQHVRIWGNSDKKEVILKASWGGEPVRAVVHDGRWEAQLPTPAGSCQPQTLTLNDADSQLILSNVLIGELWICSGQSNMSMPIRGYTGQPVEESMRTALESPRYRNQIRMITLPRRDADTPQRDFEGKWEVPTPQTTLRMSAAAYFFARALTDVLNVPVGIVAASWGGSKIEAWMDSETLTKMGYDVQKINADSTIDPRAKCTKLYNGLIAPLAGCTARGFLWYQGESNRKQSATYAQLMLELVSFWRLEWDDTKSEMPFLYVQIAPYAYDQAEATDGVQVMEAQRDALVLIPNSAMIATTDLGDKDCIHPAAKRPVGERLALEALNRVYGMRIPDAGGVTIDHVEYQDGKAVLTFNNARYGLIPQGEPIPGFELAGKDGVFHPATAVIVHSKPMVEVSCEQVPEPVKVRYAFHNYTPTTLSNTLGIPAFPFRTDRN